MTKEYKAMLYSVMWQLDSAYNILNAMASDMKATGEDSDELITACHHLNTIYAKLPSSDQAISFSSDVL